MFTLITFTKFATLSGYASPEEWAKVTEPFPDTFVDEKSQNTLVAIYQKAMAKMVAFTVDIT